MSPMTAIKENALQSLLRHEGPVCSVYFRLEARPEQEDEAQQRWHALARSLSNQRVDTATIEALGDRVRAALPGSGVLAAFAAEGEILFATELPGADLADTAIRTALPRLLPVLEWRQNHPAHVLALVDRAGADLETYPDGGTEALRQTITGADDEIVRNAPGGMSQGRFQNRAEDSWEHNAARVATALSRAVGRVSAHLVLLAGDVRALQYLTKHLPKAVRHQVTIRTVSGGRGHDGAGTLRSAQVEAATLAAAAEETSETLRNLAEERRPGGHAVEGMRATLTALAHRQVSTLLVTQDGPDGRTAWFGPAPTDVSVRRRKALEPGGPALDLTGAPLADVAVRAALLTGADVRVIELGRADAPAQGIGALCRYS
ncbi:baeRF2 domain-containing protein [Streptomyces erythrochromogenes]|uniref:baeRF2 domain-containing protein n=1 Tax=Streptomyces erythrochromogenes TaxID=285574 RepID=UPI003804F841